jgi:hypothetical protein
MYILSHTLQKQDLSQRQAYPQFLGIHIQKQIQSTYYKILIFHGSTN